MKHGGAGWSGTSAITCFLSEAYREAASAVFVSRIATRTQAVCVLSFPYVYYVFSLCITMYFPYVFVHISHNI
jgi:hypothetical protein